MSAAYRIALSSAAPPRRVPNRASNPAIALAIALASPLLVLAACDSEPSGGPMDAGPVPDAGPPDAPPWPPCPLALQASATAPVRKCLPPGPLRYSLAPVYQTTPDPEQFVIHRRAMSDSDFQIGAVGTSVAQKLDVLGILLGGERGHGPLALFPDDDQRARASHIPFRGNPGDVVIVTADGQRRAYVPLGGDAMTPGNEVAAVSLDSGEVTHIRVGVHPQQVYAHEASGLVFVCNQYSNFVSIIDGRKGALLIDGGLPVELPMPHFCSDLVVVPRDPASGSPDALHVYVANEQLAAVLKYEIEILRDINDDVAGVVLLPLPGQDPDLPKAVITGVGGSPSRLALDETQTRLYVSNHRGGELAVIDLATDRVLGRVELGAPAIDVVRVADRLFVPTTTPYRGLLQQGAPAADDVLAAPVTVTGVDGQQHELHPGSRFDATASYDVEDLRSGIFQIKADDGLAGEIAYVTDDNDADAAFTAEQKQLAGALPRAIARNAAGTRVYVPLFGSDLVQELEVTADAIGLRATGRTFATRELPAAVAVDEESGQLLVASFGGEVLETFDLETGDRVSEIDLGYAQPRYPATTIEAGEYLFATARWSNDGRKSCAGCHSSRLSTDGLGFAVGTAAPTTLRPVRPMHDLMATGPYLWSGGAPGGNLGAMAFAAQARTNCELVLYGLVEGPHTAPAERDGDPANFTRDPDAAALCRPDTASLDPATGLPGRLGGGTFDDIRAEIAAEGQIATQAMTAAVRPQLESAGLFRDDPTRDREEMERAIGFYLVAELRLPPNPFAPEPGLYALDPEIQAKISQGEALFREGARCTGCHNSLDEAHPYTDNRYFGPGSAWLRNFVTTYDDSPVLAELLPDGMPAPLLAAAEVDAIALEPTVFRTVLDGLVPFCFSATHCLRLDDPLAVRGSDSAEEARRLRRLAIVYLTGAGFFPGAIVGQPMVHTPSLRGVWLQRSLLHHGLARTLEEAILPPGHAALAPDQRGYAADVLGNFDVHGPVRDLTPEQVEALTFYLRAIE